MVGRKNRVAWHARAEHIARTNAPQINPEAQPYAEQGPIFLHARACARHVCQSEVPEMLESETYIVRGYDANNRIVYGTGKIVPTDSLPTAADQLFADEKIVYAHVRSAANNCYQCRIDRD